MMSQRFASFLLILICVVFTACDGAGGEMQPEGPFETAIDPALLEGALQAPLWGAEVRLNNYGDRGEERDDSWYRSEDGFVRIGAAELRFSIPESRTSVGPFRVFYYVRDLNVLSDSVRVESVASGDSLLLTAYLPFEEEGTEFKGHCLSSTFLGTGSCLGSRDRIVPDIQLQNARLAVTFRPVVLQGSLSLEPVDAAFEGTVQAGGVCTINIGVDICDVLTDYRSTIRETLETEVFGLLDDGLVQVFLAAQVQPLLATLGIGEVLALRVEGERLIIVHQ